MAWTTKPDGKLDLDGKPFDAPADSFERMYNAHIQENGEPPEHHDIDPTSGWPFSTRTGDVKPKSSEEVRRTLDAFFNPHMQEKALDAGNDHDELDTIAKKLLAWAAYYRTPVTASEGNVAKRLGVDTSACPEQKDSRIIHHSRLGI